MAKALTKSVKKVLKEQKEVAEKKDAAAIHALKHDLLANRNVGLIVNKVMNAALDDEHKHQAAAWKLIMDRALPQSVFEQEVSNGQTRNAIQINISTMGGAATTDIIEGEIDGDN